MVGAIPGAKREGWHLKQMRNNDQEPQQRAGGKATNSFSRRGNRIRAKKEGNPFDHPIAIARSCNTYPRLSSKNQALFKNFRCEGVSSDPSTAVMRSG
jgi:hypothetical protein